MIPVRGFEAKKVAVFGLARTGLAAARALRAGGAEVVVWDENAAARDTASAEGFALEDLRSADWLKLSALVLSPGVPLTHPKPHWTVEKAREAGVEIMGDIELFARTVAAAPAHKRPKIVAITGTNGKSTTTALIGHVCRQAGRDVRIGGNIGVGVLDLEHIDGAAVHILEVQNADADDAADAHVAAGLAADVADQGGGGRLAVGAGDGDDFGTLVRRGGGDRAGEQLDVAHDLDAGFPGLLDRPVRLGMS